MPGRQLNGIRHGLTQADRQEQQRRALELRARGASLQAIADDLGISLATASRRVQLALRQDVHHAARQLRELEGARLDGVLQRLQEILDDDAARPADKVQALRTVVSTVTERRNLFGLTPPIRQDITVTPGPLPAGELSSVEAALGLRPALDGGRDE